MSIKFAQNELTRKMNDFDTFTKIPHECERFGQINCCQRLSMVDQSTTNRPIWLHCCWANPVLHLLLLKSITAEKLCASFYFYFQKNLSMGLEQRFLFRSVSRSIMTIKKCSLKFKRGRTGH